MAWWQGMIWALKVPNMWQFLGERWMWKSWKFKGTFPPPPPNAMFSSGKRGLKGEKNGGWVGSLDSYEVFGNHSLSTARFEIGLQDNFVVGFKYVLFSPRTLGKMNPFWRAYFSKRLVQPPTRFGCSGCVLLVREGKSFPASWTLSMAIFWGGLLSTSKESFNKKRLAFFQVQPAAFVFWPPDGRAQQGLETFEYTGARIQQKAAAKRQYFKSSQCKSRYSIFCEV